MFRDIWGADSGDIVSAIFTNGSIHPPGFPIYYLLGQLFKYLPIGTPTQKIALISFLFALLTLINIFLILKFLFKDKIKYGFGLFSIAASLSLMFFSHSYLIYSLTPEIYTASTFFITLNLYFLLRFMDKFEDKYHLRFWLTFFIDLFFHYLIMINLFVYFMFNKNRLKKVKDFLIAHKLKFFSYFLLAISPYLLFYLAWDQNSLVYWESKNFSGLIRLIFRSEYGFFSTSQGSYQSFFSKFQNLGFYFRTLISNFTLLGLTLSMFGIFALLKDKKKYGQVLVLLLFFYGPGLLFYLDADMNKSFSMAIVERFVLLSFPFVAIFIFAGYMFLFRFLNRFLALIIKNNRLKELTKKIILTMLIFIFPLAFILKNTVFIVQLAKNNYFKIHSENIINSLPKNSILLLSKDMYLFPAEYYRYVLKQRADIVLISLSKLSKSQYIEALKTHFPSLKFPNSNVKRFEYEFIKKNLEQYRVFTSVFINGPDIKLRGFGFLDEIVLKDRRYLDKAKLEFNYQFLTNTSYVYPVYFFDVLKDEYSSYFFNQMIKYKQKNQQTLALAAIAKAYQTDPKQHNINTGYALLLYKKGYCKKAKLVLLRDYLNKQFAETAFILSRLFASCDHDYQEYSYWDQKYQLLK